MGEREPKSCYVQKVRSRAYRHKLSHAGRLTEGSAVINITNIGIRQMLLASALVMAASGNVSAQTSSPVIVKGTTFAVIAKGSVPYYTSGSLSDVGTTPPQGQFAAGQHICANWEVTLHGRELINVDLPSDIQVDRPDGGKADAIYSAENFIPDPAGDKKCESNTAQFATQPKSTDAGSGKFFIPDSVTDSALRRDIADMAEFIHSYPSIQPTGQNLDYFSTTGENNGTYNLIKNDPAANNIMTKVAIAEGFYHRGSQIPETNNGWLYDDKKFNDLQRARLWYQMVLDQIRTTYPDIHPDVRTCANHYPCPSDPSGSLRSLINVVENRIQFCPTALQRQQELAVAEKTKKDAAVLQEEAAKEAAKEERDAAAYQKAADPFDIAYVFRNFITEDSLKRMSVIHALGGDGLSQEEYSKNYYSFKRQVESMKVIVNDKNKQVDGSYIAIITYWVDGNSHTSKVGYLKGADGLVITCYNTEDGSHNCK